tara:strand:+ start:11068 stop:13128 length:2061 start_codon:yes stop_codon:yes gene_type:complete
MYLYQGIFAVLRIIVCFYLLFGMLAPLFLPKIKKESGIDLLMYSWVGLGGLIVVDVFILTVLNLYDFISLFITLICIPVIVYIIKRWRDGLTLYEVLLSIETRLISQHVRVIENTSSLWDRFKNRFLKKPSIDLRNTTPQVLAFIIASIAAFIRIIPALQNSAPFSRTWYFELSHVKALSLQQYFEVIPEPRGMHALVHVFSTLTQVTPELILHILGALTSFFLALIIFWVINVITDSKNQVASLVGMAIYSFTPMYLTPIILDFEVEANSISLALCFAIPTCVFFLRHIRLDKKAFWFYISMGIFATALVNLFVFIIVLIPVLLLGLLTLPLSQYLKRFLSIFAKLFLIIILAISPYIIVCFLNGISIRDFFQQELFDTLVFSYFPNLVVYLDRLSIYYFEGAVFLILINIVFLLLKKTTQKKELVFLILFAIISFIYTPFFPFSYIIIDPDQLNLFYSVTISVFIGIVFLNVLRLFEFLKNKSNRIFTFLNGSIAIIGILSIIFLQGGIFISRSLPETLPNGFFDAYYTIVNERVPYTYATVSPELDRGLAENRHFFMNYEFFLDNYGIIDSLYQQYLLVPKALRTQKEIPPASIFLFLEKPPYSAIQQGILYDSQNTMKDMEQWIQVFSGMKGRNIKVYYESEDAIIFEIINREKESRISSVLNNIYPENELQFETTLDNEDK